MLGSYPTKPHSRSQTPQPLCLWQRSASLAQKVTWTVSCFHAFDSETRISIPSTVLPQVVIFHCSFPPPEPSPWGQHTLCLTQPLHACLLTQPRMHRRTHPLGQGDHVQVLPAPGATGSQSGQPARAWVQNVLCPTIGTKHQGEESLCFSSGRPDHKNNHKPLSHCNDKLGLLILSQGWESCKTERLKAVNCRDLNCSVYVLSSSLQGDRMRSWLCWKFNKKIPGSDARAIAWSSAGSQLQDYSLFLNQNAKFCKRHKGSLKLQILLYLLLVAAPSSTWAQPQSQHLLQGGFATACDLWEQISCRAICPSPDHWAAPCWNDCCSLRGCVLNYLLFFFFLFLIK